MISRTGGLHLLPVLLVLLADLPLLLPLLL
jgi:hypothetical protein